MGVSVGGPAADVGVSVGGGSGVSVSVGGGSGVSVSLGVGGTSVWVSVG